VLVVVVIEVSSTGIVDTYMYVIIILFMIDNDINNAPLLWPWLAVAVAVSELR
jgi:hypothetical protein